MGMWLDAGRRQSPIQGGDLPSDCRCEAFPVGIDLAKAVFPIHSRAGLQR
jgi:hypothetical protein